MNTYITTTIPYVNARPHIGFALELVQADALARYLRLRGETVRLQTGTDENAWKNVESAQAQGCSPQDFVDRNTAAFRELAAALHISVDVFVRTSEARHHRAVHALWRCLRQEDLYRKQYAGLYCVGCEDFVLERELVDGCCPDHRAPPVEVQEENYFFRLSAYQEQLDALITTGRLAIVPEFRRNEVLSFIRRGLHDISISRSSARSGGWGIGVPDDATQTVYVWIDALINYLTGLGFGDGEDWRYYWSAGSRKIHCLGKNVWKFHAVYWPALLLSAGLPLPDRLLVHGFLTVDGQKIGKSLGNAVDPFTLIETYGADAVRYYLLRLAPWDDGDYTDERLRLAYNADMANNLGNLVSRLTTLAQRGGLRWHAPAGEPAAPAGFHEAWQEYAFDRALGVLFEKLTVINQEIGLAEPWKALKAGDFIALHAQLTGWLNALFAVVYWLAPFLPDTSRKVRDLLTAEPLTTVPPLFPRR